MIAPLREGDETRVATSTGLGRARRAIAAALLPTADPHHRPAPRLALWKAWLMAGWALLVVGVYLVLLLRAYA